MMKQLNQLKLPTTKQLLRVAVALIVVLALLAGLFAELYRGERKRYLRLEDRYVRVRNQIGTDQMQQMIDDSYTE